MCRYDLKYWPQLSEIVEEMAIDASNANIVASDPLTDAATESQRNSLSDFFKALFAHIEESIELNDILSTDFKLTDESLATIANCSLNLDIEKIVDAPYVKRLRQRIRDKTNDSA